MIPFLNSDTFRLGYSLVVADVVKACMTWSQIGMVVHPVMQVIGEQALVDILDLFEVAWTCWGVFTPRSGLGLRMVKELDLQLALGMNERR